jgi:hypothetical protein
MKSFLAVVLIFSYQVIYCQTTNISNNLWISGGPGIYQSDYFRGLTLNSSLNWTRVKLIDTNKGTLGKSTNFEFRLNKYRASYDEDNYENFTEISLLYGKSFGKVLQLKIAGGLGLLTGIKTAGFNPPGTPQFIDNKVSTPGIPFTLGINLIPGKYFGLGVEGYINLYPKNTISGVNIRLLFGKIR